MIFPDLVLGRSSTTYTALGAANGPIDLRTWKVKLFRISGEFAKPSFRDTNALTAGRGVSAKLSPGCEF